MILMSSLFLIVFALIGILTGITMADIIYHNEIPNRPSYEQRYEDVLPEYIKML